MTLLNILPMHFPKISIIIPAYNAEKYLQETLESIFAQDYPSVEIIVVDDGSTDSTSNIVESYSHDSRVQYIYKLNSGTAKSRNVGIKRASGDFLMFVDADDLLVPTAISQLMSSFLELNEQYCMVYGERECFSNDSNEILEITDLRSELRDRMRLFDFRTNLILGSLIPKELLDWVGGFDETIRFNEDHEMALKLSKAARLYGMGEIVYRYRVHSGSKTALRSYDKAIEVTKGRLNYYRRLISDEDLIAKAWAYRGHYLMAGVEFKGINKRLSCLYFIASFLAFPLNLVPLRLLIASLRGRY